MMRPEKLGLITALAIAFTCSLSTAGAQCDPGGGVGGAGVDLIVGDIPTASTFGEAADFFGFSFGVTLCNIGTDPSQWASNSGDHPVILQNLYRLQNGRFEQIGASWLRHLLLPVAQDGCGCGCVPAGFSALGAGCSDTTSAAVNGSQALLAAPSELLDVTTGAWIYPPVLDPPIADLTARRIRVAESDLDPFLNLGAEYFAEVIVYSGDDAAAGNGANSASVRPLVFGNAPVYPIGFIGPTARQKSALEVWADRDPEVLLAPIDDGQGGQLLLATKVTDLGGGEWAYEYALSNVSSGRGARKFTILTGAAAVSGLGFHDVDPHSGDVFEGTDWGTSLASGVLSWETQNVSTNQFANAIRAGRTFNFRLVADSAPVASNVAVYFFENSGPALTTVATMSPADSFIDCNNNFMADFIDIQSGESLDCDGNGVPDECDDPIYLRGDANLDLTIDVADPVTILAQLFQAAPVPCESAADGNGDASRDIADAIYLLNHLFANGAPPPAPYPTCGAAATPGALGCCSSACP